MDYLQLVLCKQQGEQVGPEVRLQEGGLVPGGARPQLGGCACPRLLFVKPDVQE